MTKARKARKLKKTDYICYLLDLRGPQTRDQLTHGAWVMEGMRIPYKVRSNNCYFVPGTGLWDNASLVYRGLIKVVGKQGHKFLYDLTPAGRKVAQAAIPRIEA